jgi:hypothetical protein
MTSKKTTDPAQSQSSARKTDKSAPAAAEPARQAVDPAAMGSSIADPEMMTPQALLAVQRSAGNRAVQRLLSTRAVQARLTVGPAGDTYEQEADRVAAQVMRMPEPEPASVQRNEAQEDEEKIQTKPAVAITPLVQRETSAHDRGCGCAACTAQPVQREMAEGAQAQLLGAPGVSIQRATAAHDTGCTCAACSGGAIQRHEAAAEDEVQRAPAARSAADGFDVSGDIESQIKHPAGGSPLADGVRDYMEPRFGADFSGVRVHADPSASDLNRTLHSDAFTHGQDIYMGADKYDPGSTTGRQLLAHELTHVVQQTGGGVQAKYSERDAPGHTPARDLDPEQVQRLASAAPMIQRHSSWEHKMLGDVEPEDLFVMGAARDFRAQADAEKAKGKQGKTEDQIAVRILNSDGSSRHITKQDILHVLNQEMDRLKVFRSSPPTAATPEAVEALRLKYQEIKEEREREEAEPSLGQKAAHQLARPYNWVKGKIGAGGNGAGQAGPEAQAEGGPGERQDPQWQVRLLEIVHDTPGKSGRKVNVITYGEMNTLADIYGNVAEIKQANPDNFFNIVQGIRQQNLFKLMGIYEEVSGKKLNSRLNPLRLGEGFDDAVGNTGRGGGVLGEIRMMDMLPLVEGKKAQKGEDGETAPETSYSAGLARNACHFAPESWHAWAKYHQDARSKAREAYRLKQETINEIELRKKSGIETDEALKQTLLAPSQAAEREALMLNGFGDHFLQDSYAAGHLINKTEIMKWFVEWLDDSWSRADYTASSDWEQIQQMAYNQPELGAGTGADPSKDLYNKSNIGRLAAKDPQSVANMEGTMEERFTASGLKLPVAAQPGHTANKVLVAWQQAAAANEDKVKQTAADLSLLSRQRTPAVEVYLKQMVVDGVAKTAGTRREGATLKYFGGTVHPVYELTGDYLPKNAAAFRKQAWQMGRGGLKANADYRQAAVKATYKKYFTFMNHKTLQLSTNVLHDHFCKEGLDVQTRGGYASPFRIYGDDAMLQKESSKGLLHSATTANMSRDAIYALLRGEEPAVSLETIGQRFPSHVVLKGTTTPLSLANWHRNGELKELCVTKIFPKTRSFGDAAGWKTKMLGTFTPNKLESVLSPDEAAVHGGQPF